MPRARTKSRRSTKSQTSLRERVAELERERALLNAIANYAPSLICLIDPDGTVRPYATNRAFERTLGYEPEETGGVCFWERYVPDGERATARDCVLTAVRTQAAASHEGRWLQRDGTEFEVSWTCTPLPKISSGPVYLISGTDITDRKRHEAEVRQSRTRIVAAADNARRRLERNLHDGAQQRLVSLLLQLRAAQRGLTDPAETLEAAVDELAAAVKELRELAQGIHPTVLTDRGLAAAVELIAARSSVPVELRGLPWVRVDESAEATAYYVIAEAVTNAQRYARASSIWIDVDAANHGLHVEVGDDGAGGAVESTGSGLQGLRDRVEATGGTFALKSAPGRGTRVAAVIALPHRT
jgi:PAS domain S-box-containing protein